MWVVARLSRNIIHKPVLNKGSTSTLTQIQVNHKSDTWQCFGLTNIIHKKYKYTNAQIHKYTNTQISNLAKFWDQRAVCLANVILVTLDWVLHLLKIIRKSSLWFLSFSSSLSSLSSCTCKLCSYPVLANFGSAFKVINARTLMSLLSANPIRLR